MIKIENLNFSYDNKLILKDINFTIDKPQFISIIGPNGSGKTTLLKNICGLLKPHSGKILYGDMELLKLKRKELSKLVAIVNQNQEIPYEYLVEDFVEMGTYVLYGKIKKGFLSEIYNFTDIENFSNRYVSTLSSGEKQRVYIARALAQDTPILLLDEPISNLDLKHQVIIMELCKTLVKKGITIICILHDMNFALNYSDKIMVMKNGEIRLFDSKESITEEIINEVFEQEVKFITYEEKIVVIPK